MNKKTKILFSLSFILCGFKLIQPNTCTYLDLVNKAELALTNHEYKLSLGLYHKAFEKNVFFKDLKNYFTILHRYSDSSLFVLECLNKVGKYIQYKNLTADLIENNVVSSGFKNKYLKNFNVDKPYNKVMDSLISYCYNEDQRIRDSCSMFYSTSVALLRKKRVDMLNKRILLSSNQFDSICLKSVGQSNLFKLEGICTHLLVWKDSMLLQRMEKLSKKGRISPLSIASLKDRLNEEFLGKTPVYGLISNTIFNDSILVINIRDSMVYNKNRKRMCLESYQNCIAKLIWQLKNEGLKFEFVPVYKISLSKSELITLLAKIEKKRDILIYNKNVQ